MWNIYNHPPQELWAWSQMFSEEECVNLINEITTNHKMEQAKLWQGEDESYRRSNIYFLESSNPAWEEIYRRVTDVLIDVNQRFFRYEISRIQDLQFTMYDSKENHFYGMHMDTIQEESLPRKLSFSCQLSDPTTYEGGDFNIFTSKYPTTVERKRGLSCFFNSYLMHEVTPVTSGTRYSLVGWVDGPPFK